MSKYRSKNQSYLELSMPKDPMIELMVPVSVAVSRASGLVLCESGWSLVSIDRAGSAGSGSSQIPWLSSY